jgi:hypothetical protein
VNKVDEVAVVQRRLIFQAAVASSVLAGLAIFTGRWPEALGVLSGTLVAILNLCLLARSIRSLLSISPRAARVKGAFNYIGRFMLMAAILIYSFTSPHINMYAVLVGLLMIKAVILVGAIIAYCRERLSLIFHPAPEERGDE